MISLKKIAFFLVVAQLGCTTKGLVSPNSLGAPLRNSDDVCLIPSLEHKKKVVAVPCDRSNPTQNWHYDAEHNILRNMGDRNKAWLVKNGETTLPRVGGARTMLFSDGDSQSSARVILSGQTKTVVDQAVSTSVESIKISEKTVLSPGGRLDFKHLKKMYQLKMEGVRDYRCPKDAFCLVPGAAYLDFILSQGGADKYPKKATVRYQTHKSLPASALIGDKQKFVIIVENLTQKEALKGGSSRPKILFEAEVRLSLTK